MLLDEAHTRNMTKSNLIPPVSMTCKHFQSSCSRIHVYISAHTPGSRVKEREREKRDGKMEKKVGGMNQRTQLHQLVLGNRNGNSKRVYEVLFLSLVFISNFPENRSAFLSPLSYKMRHARSTLWRNSKPVVQCSVPLFSSPAPFKFLFEGITWKNTKRNKRSKWLSIKLSCPSIFLISSYQNTINSMVIYRKIYDFNRPKSFPQFVSLHFIRNRFQKREPNS